MSPGIWQIILVVVLALLLFGGRGKISSIMGDLARGITSFRKGLKEDDEADAKSSITDKHETIDASAERASDKDKAES